MWNGFFKVYEIKDLETLKQFFRDALKVASRHHVDILKSWKRERYPELSSEEYIENHITLDTHNVCIDRSQNSKYNNKEGEIGSSTFNSPSLFLFIYVELKDLYNLVEKYNLSKRLI